MTHHVERSGALGDKMMRSQSDFPSVANLKVLITENAIEHSDPNETILKDDEGSGRL